MKKISITLTILMIFSIMLFADIGKGIEYFTKGNLNKAITELLPHAKNGTKDKRVYYALFNIYYRRRQLNEAIKWGVEFLKYGADYQLTHNLTLAFYQLKKYKKVIRLSQYANAKFGDKHEFYNLMGMAYYYKEQYQLAEVAIRMANTLAPNSYLYRYNYGRVLYKRGQLQSALKQLTRSIQLNPNYPNSIQVLKKVKKKLSNVNHRQ